jgi:hypothetical protein
MQVPDTGIRRVRCHACGHVLTHPDQPAADSARGGKGRNAKPTPEERRRGGRILEREEELEDIEREEKPEEPASRKKPRRRKGQSCFVCEEAGEGQSYSFWTAIRKETARMRADDEFDQVTFYKKITPHSVYLCDQCAGKAWRRYYLTRSLIFFSLLFVLLLGVLLTLQIGGVSPAALIFLGVLALLAVPVLWELIPAVRLLSPSFESRAMSPVVISVAKPHVRTKGMVFLTDAEMAFLQEHGDPY